MAENSSTAVEQSRRYGQMIARAWTEPAFKERLLAEPATVAREQGLEIPEGTSLRAIEIAPRETYLVLPPPDQDAGVSAGEQGPWTALLERAASDPAYKARLIAEPVSTLAEQGIELAEGARVTVVEPSDTEGYLFVPPIPEGMEIEAIDDDTTGHSTCGASSNTDGMNCKCNSCSGGVLISSFSQIVQPRAVSLLGPGLLAQRGFYGTQFRLR
ncbi:MAG: nitrile hydratase subunit alpha [Dehalococcoidia bacterium]